MKNQLVSLGLFAIATWPGWARAALVRATAPEPPSSQNALEQSENDLQFKIKQIDEQISTMNSSIRSKAKVFHSFKNGASSPQFFWEEESSNPEKRKKLSSLVRVEIRELVRRVETLEQRREELAYEMEWLRVRIKDSIRLESGNPHFSSSPAKKIFYCGVSPVAPLEERVQVTQPFGTHKDSDTGLEWQSSGWWVSRLEGHVKACAPGVVAYTGKVPGRGRVILIDHGGGNMTLYANMNDDPEISLTRGSKVAAGTLVGTSRERLYFEVRRNGVAVDPKEVISLGSLSKFSL